jgi:prepilin-type N-terminal cleavage/methylation domain-containing protein
MSDDGFSLIEVLVAMALALVLILGTAELVSLSIWARQKGDRASAAAQILAGRLESLKALAFEGGGLEAGTDTAATWHGPSRTSFLEEWTVEEAGDGLKRVRISVRPAVARGTPSVVSLFISTDLGFMP